MATDPNSEVPHRRPKAPSLTNTHRGVPPGRQGGEEGREQGNGEEGDSGAGRREVGRQAAATPWRASHILARVPNVLHRRRAGR